MKTIGFKNAAIEVEYEPSWDDVEVVNVFYKGVNVNELLNDADMETIYEELVSVLCEEAHEAIIDRMYD
jgi:hypothetical protein